MNDKHCDICHQPIMDKANYMVASGKEKNTYAEIYLHFACYAQVTQDKEKYENLKKRMGELCQ
jgi:hypothetical protein